MRGTNHRWTQRSRQVHRYDLRLLMFSGIRCWGFGPQMSIFRASDVDISGFGCQEVERDHEPRVRRQVHRNDLRLIMFSGVRCRGFGFQMSRERERERERERKKRRVRERGHDPHVRRQVHRYDLRLQFSGYLSGSAVMFCNSRARITIRIRPAPPGGVLKRAASRYRGTSLTRPPPLPPNYRRIIDIGLL